MPDDPAKPPRFPYVAALLCAACIVAAAWTWMRYSYCWGVTPRDFWVRARTTRTHAASQHAVLAEPSPNPGITGTYVRLSGRFEDLDMHGVDLDAVAEPDDLEVIAFVGFAMVGDRPPDGAAVSLRGRIVQLKDDTDDSPVLDTTASRWHGASIAGLAIGAMGVFVFAVALRHWLGERRRFREDMRGHNHSVERSPSDS